MRKEPHYTDLLTREFFEEYYVDKKMSYPKIREMLMKEGHNVHSGTLWSYARKLGIGRSSREARQNWGGGHLDYQSTYIHKDMLEYVDGFLLGDGGISFNLKRSHNHVARLCCGVEYQEFCEYLMQPFERLVSKVTKDVSKSMKQGFMFSGRTRHHPDIYKQYLRWYPENKNGQRVKQPPEDVRITPESVMRWYLGDGSVVVKNNTISVRLSTDGFEESKVEMLVDRLKKKGIKCHRNNENRIRVDARGIPSFFDLIGRESPIKCYDYKFDKIPFWRFESKRMKEVAEELNVDYGKLSYFVSIGKVGAFRLSEKGRPRFLPEHIKGVKKLIKDGEL